MKRLLVPLGVLGASLAFAVSFAHAQNTTSGNVCANADTNNMRVKNSCTGRIVESWDDNKCLWLKCDTSATSDTCADAKASNEKTRMSCTNGKFVTGKDDKGCEWLKCSESTTATSSGSGDMCAGARESNAKMKRACGDSPMTVKTDANGCEWMRCADPATAAADECKAVREKLGMMDSSTAEYAALKKKWNERCGNAMSPSDNVGVQCMKHGCTVKCVDGTSYNVCQLPSTPTMRDTKSSSSSSTTAATCKRTKDEKGCTVVTCSNGRTGRACPNTSSSSSATRTDNRPAAGVTCKTTREGSCVITRCSDGKEKKECAR